MEMFNTVSSTLSPPQVCNNFLLLAPKWGAAMATDILHPSALLAVPNALTIT